ncbi:MAG: hypothetical protein JWN88_2172 [Frankiales bacterium]|jgi:hypothetical protein|nr:hypothetical protein [Frankiales bacterium]
MCWYCDNPEGDYYGDVVRPAIARRGWMVQYVEPHGPRAPFAYTAGLTARSRPELVVTGLPDQSSAELLDAAARTLSEPVDAGQRLVLGGRDFEVVHVREPAAHLFVAASLYGPRLTALQLVYPDERGTWPWSRGFRGGRGGQPVLGPRGSS